jgi:hypothetical protein
LRSWHTVVRNPREDAIEGSISTDVVPSLGVESLKNNILIDEITHKLNALVALV